MEFFTNISRHFYDGVAFGIAFSGFSLLLYKIGEKLMRKPKVVINTINVDGFEVEVNGDSAIMRTVLSNQSQIKRTLSLDSEGKPTDETRRLDRLQEEE